MKEVSGHMLYLLHAKAIPKQVRDVLLDHKVMIKIVADVRRHVMAAGGNMHHECDLWGANWYPEQQSVEFEALINIRPRQGNPNRALQDPALRRAVDKTQRTLLSFQARSGRIKCSTTPAC